MTTQDNLSPLQLFREPYNMDTMQIANLLKTTEAEVEKQIHAARGQETSKERKRTWRRDYMRLQRAEARA